MSYYGWTDNVTAIAFINKMGGTHSQLLSNLAVEMWEWCLEEAMQNTSRVFRIPEQTGNPVM